MISKRKFTELLTLGFILVLLSCEGGQMGAREKGAIGGAALGAGLGAIVGNQVGSAGAGVAIGSAFGAISGALIGNELQKQDDALEDRKQKMSGQEREIEENRKIIAELRAKGVDAKVSDRGVLINLPDVLFAFGSAQLTGVAKETVSDISNSLEGRTTGRRVAVEGHTDSVGSTAYNQNLSQERARSVARQLAAQGIPDSQIKVRGFGETKPVASNETESGRQRNRRVEVILENR